MECDLHVLHGSNPAATVHLEKQRRGAEESREPVEHGVAAIDHDELEVLAGLDGEVDRLAEQRVVRTQPMAAGLDLAREDLAVEERCPDVGVEAHKHLPLAAVARMMAADGDQRPQLARSVVIGVDAKGWRRLRPRQQRSEWQQDQCSADSPCAPW